MFYKVMVLIYYLKKYALAIVYKEGTSQRNLNLLLPSLPRGVTLWLMPTKSLFTGRASKFLRGKFKLLRVQQSRIWNNFLRLENSLLSFSFGVMTQQETECVKIGPSGGSTNRPHTTPAIPANKRMTDIGHKQFTGEKGNLCCSLHLTCF